MADLAALVAGVRKGVEATRSMDEATRRQAEAQFAQLSTQQYPRLVYALGEIMKDNSTPLNDVVRQQASVLLSGFIKPRDPRKRAVYAKLWTDQTDAFKLQVKQQLIAAMRSPGADGAGLSRSAAACLAEIAILEIPHNKWPTFAAEMKTLCQTAESTESDIAVRKAAATLIGQVCTFLEPDRHLSQSDVNSLLGSVCACMTSRSPDVVAAAMLALTNSLKFIARNMEIKQQRDHLVTELIEKGVKSPSPKVQEKALQCLVVMCDDYYTFLPEYIKQIMELTLQLVKAGSVAGEVKIQAIEVWNTILEVELDLVAGNHQIMKHYGLHLVPVLMQTMVFRDEITAESDDLVPERAAGTTLRLLSSLLKSNEILQSVMGFVAKCLALPPTQWAQREMAFKAMGYVMEVGADPQTAKAIAPLITSCVGAIVKATTGPDKRVTQSAALNALDRIFVYALNQFADHNFALQTLNHTLTILKTSRDPLLAMRAATCIRSYHKFFKFCDDSERLSLVQRFCPPKVHTAVLQAVTKASLDRKAQLSDNNLGLCIFDCLQRVISVPNLIYANTTAEANKPYYVTIHKVYNHYVQQLIAVIKDQSMSVDVRNIYAAGYLSALWACLVSFNHDEYREAIITTSKPATEALLRCCFSVKKLSGASSIQDDALNVLTNVVSILGDKAFPYVGNIMQHMKSVLDDQSSGESERKQAIGLISEVYGCGWNAPPGADDQIMQLLLKLMSDDNLSRDTKPSILEAITCMLTTLQGRFMKYMGHVLPILGGAMSVEKPVGTLDEDAEETAKFVDKLRYELVVFISELCQVPEAKPTLADANFQRTLGTFMLKIVQPGQWSNDEVPILRAIILEDLDAPPTKNLAQTLARQQAVQNFIRGTA